MKKIGILSLITLLLIAGCGETKQKNQESKQSVTKKVESNIKVGIEKGNKIPDFKVMRLDGEIINMEDLKGKYVLLNFWATWCPPCRREMPSIQKLYDDNRSNDKFEIVAISVDQKQAFEVQKFVDDNGYSFPIYYDKGGVLSRKFFIKSIPTTFLVNKDGIIENKVLGGSDWSKLNVQLLTKGVK
ncbi:TlpA family protein disulfide reductase [Haliovirga abyssi]|uniref:Thioredoxin n=1 Tax=Haliovirga abyssi TaxID=2996794 RepID=A0AAU9D2P7_9FUSO|nr:TlpA disulfide reductase family protein [Haliovirga abyssi]BDU50269.1 thioredoxin [Haliovirga abyssi]